LRVEISILEIGQQMNTANTIGQIPYWEALVMRMVDNPMKGKGFLCPKEA